MSSADSFKLAADIAAQNINCRNGREENSKVIKQEIEKNHKMINEFLQTLSSTEGKSKNKENKNKEIERKRQELLSLQETLISLKERKTLKKEKKQMNSFEQCPIVVNKIHDILFQLSETAITNPNKKVSVFSMLKAAQIISQLTDLCQSEGFIDETDEEKEKRHEKEKEEEEKIRKYFQKDKAKKEEEEEDYSDYDYDEEDNKEEGETGDLYI